MFLRSTGNQPISGRLAGLCDHNVGPQAIHIGYEHGLKANLTLNSDILLSLKMSDSSVPVFSRDLRRTVDEQRTPDEHSCCSRASLASDDKFE